MAVSNDQCDTTLRRCRRATFRNQDQVWPVRVIRRGDAVRPLPPHARSLADLTFEVGGVRLGVSDYMARRRTAGLLILKHGEIALERYGMGNGPESLWTSFATANVDHRDARRRRAARRRDRRPGRSLRPLCAAAARLGLRGRHGPQCPADVLGRGLARGDRTLTDAPTMPAPGPGHGEPAARRRSWTSCATCRAPTRRAPSSTTRPARAACLRAVVAAATGRLAGRLLRRERSGDPPAWRPTGTGNSSPRRGLELGGLGVSALPARPRPLRPAGAGGRRSVQTADGCCRQAGAISPASPTARPPPSVG